MGKTHTDESRQKISEKLLGKKHSPEHIANNSAAQRGKKLSEETKKKISEAGVGRKHTEEAKQKIREAHTSTVLRQLISPDGEIFSFYSVTEFCKDPNLSNPHISSVLTGKRKHHKQWRLPAEETNPEQ